jgi:hypothetical protein
MILPAVFFGGRASSVILGSLLAGMVLFSTPTAIGQPEISSKEDEVLIKAAFLYGFGQNIEWPAASFDGPKAPFVIGILGTDPIRAPLEQTAQKKTIQGRKIVVKQFAALKDYQEPCQILFISDSVKLEQQRAAVQQLSRPGLLTVGEIPGFAEDGGVVNLYIEEDSVRFELNVEAANRAQLRMDAQLQKLGKPVAGRRETEKNPPPAPPMAAKTT